MSIELPKNCRQVIQLVKEIQIDGRPMADPSHVDFEEFRAEYPDYSKEEAWQAIRRSRTLRRRTWPRNARFDPVPDYLIRAEHAGFGPLTRPEEERRADIPRSPDCLQAVLAEVVISELLDRVELPSIRFLEYECPDGKSVEIRETEWGPNKQGNGYRVSIFQGKRRRTICSAKFYVGRCDWGYRLTSAGWRALTDQGIDGAPKERQSSVNSNGAPHSPAAKADGPHPPNHFHWRGDAHDLPPRQWALLKHMWNVECLPVQTAATDVWGRDDVADSTMRSAVSKLDTAFSKMGCPFHFAMRNGYITKTKTRSS